MTRVQKKWQGLSAHRYKDNPLEKRAALAWQELNTPGTPMSRSTIDYLMDVTNKGNISATDHERLVSSTVIQWLGSPVGFAWLCDTFGAEVVRRMQQRADVGLVVQAGQVYRSRDHRDMKVNRCVTVERLRYPYGHRLYKTGPYAQWAVRSSTSGRLSYVKEQYLLDPTRWELVKQED